MRQFDSGAIRDSDTGKLDYEGFLSPRVLRIYAEFMHRHRHLPDGSLRASDNWQAGIPPEQYMKSGIRHVFEAWAAWDEGRVDREALCAVLFNVMGLLYEDSR